MSSIAAELKINDPAELKIDEPAELKIDEKVNSNEELCIKHVCAREIPTNDGTIFHCVDDKGKYIYGKHKGEPFVDQCIYDDDDEESWDNLEKLEGMNSHDDILKIIKGFIKHITDEETRDNRFFKLFNEAYTVESKGTGWTEDDFLRVKSIVNKNKFCKDRNFQIYISHNTGKGNPKEFPLFHLAFHPKANRFLETRETANAITRSESDKYNICGYYEKKDAISTGAFHYKIDHTIPHPLYFSKLTDSSKPTDSGEPTDLGKSIDSDVKEAHATAEGDNVFGWGSIAKRVKDALRLHETQVLFRRFQILKYGNIKIHDSDWKTPLQEVSSFYKTSKKQYNIFQTVTDEETGKKNYKWKRAQDEETKVKAFHSYVFEQFAKYWNDKIKQRDSMMKKPADDQYGSGRRKNSINKLNKTKKQTTNKNKIKKTNKNKIKKTNKNKIKKTKRKNRITHKKYKTKTKISRRRQ